jgi:hypothetical protein
MELVRSRPLHEILDHEGPMRPERVGGIGLAVLAALRAAHRAGLLHNRFRRSPTTAGPPSSRSRTNRPEPTPGTTGAHICADVRSQNR